jgi:uncharacterized protein with HEPN domain
VSRRDDERVADALDAASEIAEIIELGRDAWDKDRIRRLAAERLLEIIGEAANSLTGLHDVPRITASLMSSPVWTFWWD